MRATHRNQRRPPQRLGTFVAIAVALVLGISAAGVAVFGLAATATVAYLSEDLPDPSELESLTFAQPTILYDREGEVELGRFQTVERRVIAYDDVPRLVLDATTTAEDRTFWENAGFDAQAILSAIAENASGESERGASTITQQLVRARMLPAEVVAPGSDRYVRKAKEILQSMRLSETYPGVAGKERVITAYLNEIYYGHKAYGIAAAAEAYFGVEDLANLTPAQAALLAALPKSPSTLDPYAYAEENKDGDLVVPADSPPVVRRDWVLTNLPTSRWTKLTPAELRAALEEPVVLAGDQPARFRAGHFTWQVERQLQQIVGDDIDLTTAGYRVTTTLDWRAQRLAQRWVTAAVIAPNLKRSAGERMLKQLEIPSGERGWIRALRGKDVHNAALVAIDYRTGDVLAYLGSAGYERDDLASKRFEPKYDAAGDGYRQPGSAWKPILYGAGFESKAITPGSLLLDVTTLFNAGERWAPRDADRRDRGPVLVREALQQSLNIPAVRALERIGSKAVAKRAKALGITFQGGQKAYLQAGLAGALGTVEVRPLDLTSAYGTFANGGVHVPPRMILEVRGPDGSLVWKAPKPKGKKAVSGQTAFLMNDILAGNSDPRINAALGPRPADTRAGWQPTSGGGQDRHGAGRSRPLDVRLPRSAEGQGQARARRRHLDGQQRPLAASLGRPGDLDQGRRSAVARVRRGILEEVADRQVPAPEQGRDGNDRCLVGREAGPVDARDAQGVLRPRDAADGTQRRRRGRPPLLSELWRLACRPRQGRARSVSMEPRCRGLAAPRSAWGWGRRTVGRCDGVPPGRVVVGRFPRRAMPAPEAGHSRQA